MSALLELMLFMVLFSGAGGVCAVLIFVALSYLQPRVVRTEW